MPESLIATGATEPIEALIVDVNQLALTGLTDIKIDVRRKSDGKLLDWNDMTFKASGWTTRQLALTETDATNEAGWYRYSWNTGSIVSPVANDVYTVTVRQTSLTNAANVPQVGVIRTGGFVDTVASNLDAAVSTRATPTNITAGTITTVTNVTNAPTNGDLTATMKASVTTAATAATPTAAAVTGSVGSIAADGITASSIAAGAIGASEAPLLARLDVDVSTRLATSSYTAPPSAAAVSAQVAADLATAHGAGSWATASVAGLATSTNVLDAVTAIEAYGQLHWTTATGFAVPGDAMTLTAPALTAVQAKILDDGTPFHGASVAAILAFGAPPNAATVATQVWATAHGTPSVNTFGWLAWRLAQWGTEIADKAIVGQDLLLRSPDLATTYATVRLRDKNGGVIDPAVGEPARFDP